MFSLLPTIKVDTKHTNINALLARKRKDAEARLWLGQGEPQFPKKIRSITTDKHRTMLLMMMTIIYMQDRSDAMPCSAMRDDVFGYSGAGIFLLPDFKYHSTLDAYIVRWATQCAFGPDKMFFFLLVQKGRIPYNEH